MTRQFYKPPKGFSALLFFRSRKPLGGIFCFIGPQTASYSDFWIAVCSPWERRPRLFPFSGKSSGFPEIYALPCSIKHLVSTTLLERPKGSRTGEKSGGNCQGNELAPFVYIGFPHILNQISWLTVQQGADCIKGFPRH